MPQASRADPVRGSWPWLAASSTLEEILALIAPPRWTADAACLEHPEINFFPTRGQSTAPAKQVCAGCLVRSECRAYAAEHNARHGIWGGEAVSPHKPVDPTKKRQAQAAYQKRRAMVASQ